MSPDLLERLQSSLAGSYILERELGGGGMSRVFVANETALDRRVVVKVLPPETAAGLSIERFRREIQLAARLQHPHIVPLLTTGALDGLPYFTMPYVEGESLRARLGRQGELPVAEAVRVLREIASALDYAHAHGIVHRDIKPDNVLLSGGVAMVTDFGVAKALSASSNAEHDGVTSVGVALGTPAYMSPEQATADPTVDYRTDIYAFGVLAYELLTGQTPFGGRSPAGLLAAQVNEPPEAIQKRRPALPPGLPGLVMRCLEKRPADRPQSASEIVHALDEIGTPSGGVQPTGAMPAAKSDWRPLIIGVAVVLIVAVAGAFGWRALQGRARAQVIAPQRVVVATFQNRTGDPSLEPLGAIAADWIARGLAGTGIVDVAGTSAELVARAGVNVGTTPTAIVQLGHDARAGIVISGALYKQGDSLLVEADFTDVARGKLIESVGPVSTTASKPLDGIERLRQRVTGALAPLIDSTLARLDQETTRPPSYEAYRELLRGEALFYTDMDAAAQALLHTSTIDTTYGYPLLRAISVLTNANRFREADSVVRVADRRRALLSPYESAYLDHLAADVRRNKKDLLEATRSMVSIRPSSDFARYLLAHALNETGRYRESLEILSHLDPEGGALRGRVFYYQYYIESLHGLGDLRGALELARRGERQYPGRLIAMSFTAKALASLGRTEELLALMDSAKTFSRTTDVNASRVGLLSDALSEAKAHNHPQAAARVEPQLRALLNGARSTTELELRHTARALTLLGDWKGLDAAAEALARQHANDPEAEGLRGLAAAMLGDSSRAGAAVRRLDALSRVAYGTGDDLIGSRALIAAARGDRVRAVELLRSSSSGGADRHAWHMSPIFPLLRDYPPFQELTRPRG